MCKRILPQFFEPLNTIFDTLFPPGANEFSIVVRTQLKEKERGVVLVLGAYFFAGSLVIAL